MRTRIILVRHGRSNYNDLGIFQGSSDDSFLTTTGFEMAEKTSIYLAPFEINAIYTSPLRRAQQTKDVIHWNSPNRSVSLALDELREIDLPDWQGLSYQQVRKEQAEYYQVWKETPQNFQMRSEYPVRDLFDRSRQVWAKIRSQHDGQTVLIVSHGGTIQSLIATAIGLDETVFHRMQQSNCGISILSFSSESNTFAHLESLNFTQHLGEVLPKLKEGKKGLRELLRVQSHNPNDIAPEIDLNPYQNIGLTTELKTLPIDEITDRLQKILGPNLTSSSLSLEAEKYVILHHPLALKHSIIQSLNLMIPSAHS